MDILKEKNNDILSISITLHRGEDIVIHEQDILDEEQQVTVHITVADQATCAYYISQTARHIERSAKVFSQGKIVWHEMHVGSADRESSIHTELLVSGAAAHIYCAVYATEGSRQRLTHQIFHKARQTESSMLLRGVAGDKANITYQSLIDMEAHVDHAKGKQKADFLIASPKAQVEAVPDLAIRHHMVECSHGVTMTKMQETPQFYLMSRGFSESEAKKMMLYGHIAPIAEYIHDEKTKKDFLEKMTEAIAKEYAS